MTNNKPAVLLSIQPKWCELIANGVKTVEVRKNRPKLETPFKCYIYCTTPKGENDLGLCLDKGISGNSKKVGLVYKRNYEAAKQMNMSILSGKVIGEFICDEIFPIQVFENGNIKDYNRFGMERSCVPYDEISAYTGKGRTGAGWHISNLVIYDTPKELSEFAIVDTEAVNHCEYRTRACNNPDYTNGAFLPGGYFCSKTSDWCTKCKTKPLTRAPQSWCYVEEI